MTSFSISTGSDALRYTHLFASISEEEDGYTVRVRLYNPANRDDVGRGEEIADSLETASMLVAKVADHYSIPEARIKIEIRMHNTVEGTRH